MHLALQHIGGSTHAPVGTESAALLWLHVASDAVIALAYFTIPFTLVWFVRRRRDLPFNWVFVCFATFIVACGLTHVMGVWTTWTPNWALSGGIKLVTAAASIGTAVALVVLVPKALLLPTPSQLAAANRALQDEVEERRRAEAALQEIRTDLERQVAARTEEVRASERRAEAQLQAAQRMEAVGRLAGGVAHEINNALQGVVGFATFARNRLATEDPAREDVTLALREAGRAAGVARGLLAFARRQVLDPVDVDLVEVVRAFTPMLRQALGTDHTLELLLPDAPVVVHADPNSLEQVLLNLTLNARDAVDADGQLTIRIEAQDPLPPAAARAPVRTVPHVLLEFRDNGCGMSAETLARAFEPFFTTKPQGAGTGLGLSVVYGIVQQTGGDIALDSAPGAGAVFSIYLPAGGTGAAQAAGIDDATGETAPATRGARVLVVDDDAAVRTAVARMLADAGYVVTEAENGAAALASFEAFAPDVVVTDLVMPRLNGRALGAELAIRSPGLPLLYLTGTPAVDVPRDAALPPGAPVLMKPVTEAQLLDEVGRALSARRRNAPRTDAAS